MKNIFYKVLLITTFFTSSVFAAPPTLVKDTLSSSQLSYFARMGTGVSTGDSIIRVALSGNPSNNTNNLFVGDTIGIGTTATNGPLSIFTVADIGNTAFFQINTAIGQSNAFVGAAIIATHSAIHTVTFTPQSNLTSGFWEVLIKASSISGETINDGIPDTNGFDLGQLTVGDVTCPNWGVGVTTAYSIGTTTMPLAIGDTGSVFHVITCYLGVGGTNQIGVGYSLAIGKDLSTGSQLINPSPSLNNSVEGSADVYTFYVRHRDSTSTLVNSDTIRGKIAMVEAVRVTATVDPTLTFTIDSIGTTAGNTVCGNTLLSNASNTTATQVAFGSLTLDSANDLAQHLSCVTNSDNGYVVTVYEDGNMKKIGSGTTIPDFTSLTPAAWNTFTASGWGYSIENTDVGTTIFHYTNGYKAFGNGAANAQEIMKNITTPLNTEDAFVCYRLTTSTTQEAGNYENRLIYTATSIF